MNIRQLLKTKEYNQRIGNEKGKKFRLINRAVKEGGVLYLKKHFREIDVIRFIYLNYISNNIIRDNGVYIVPYKNAKIDICENARIYVYNDNIDIGENKLKGSKAEAHVRLGNNARWVSNGGARLVFGTYLSIGKNAIFESDFFTMNMESTISCTKHIVLKKNVMIGKNVTIYDSDHHCILDNDGRIINHSKRLQIDENVWVASNSTVLKGVHIGAGSVIGAGTVVTKNIPVNTMVVTDNKNRVLNSNVRWSRKTVY